MRKPGMSPDAELRFNVYREGQIAYRAGTPCPYTDWRAGTWAKGRAAAEAYYTEQLEQGNAQDDSNTAPGCDDQDDPR